MWRSVYFASVIVAFGCSQDGPKRVSVKGRVTLDGQPLANVSVHFKPVNHTPGNGSLGPTDADGNFTLLDVRGISGAIPGEYRVYFHRFDSAPAPKPDLLPRSFTDAVNSPLRATVPDASCTVEIPLTKDGKPPKIAVVGS